MNVRFCFIASLLLINLFYGCNKPDSDFKQPGAELVIKNWGSVYGGMDRDKVVALLGHPHSIIAGGPPHQETWFYQPKNKIYYDDKKNLIIDCYIVIFESNKVSNATVGLKDPMQP